MDDVTNTFTLILIMFVIVCEAFSMILALYTAKIISRLVIPTSAFFVKAGTIGEL